jgi:hypothetical protein
MTDQQLNERFSQIAGLLQNLATIAEEHNQSIAMQTAQIAKQSEQIAKQSDQIAKHDEQIGELNAAMVSLIAQIDRFVQGRQANGH